MFKSFEMLLKRRFKLLEEGAREHLIISQVIRRKSFIFAQVNDFWNFKTTCYTDLEFINFRRLQMCLC